MFFDQDPRRQRVRRIVVFTGTAACRTIGPASSSGVTRWTVAPLDAHAVFERLALRVEPGNDGSSDGWMFRIAPGNASSSGAPTQPHEAGEANEIDAAGAERLGQRRVVTRRGRRTSRGFRTERLEPGFRARPVRRPPGGSR